MNPRDREPLVPEERELAQRLSRLGGHAQPSSALDARILAAAREAVQPRQRRTRPRWPLGVGIAASLALAVGVAWQLRPLPDTEVMQAPSEAAPAPAMRALTPAATRVDAAPGPEVRQAAPMDAIAPPDEAGTPAEAPAPAEPAREAMPRMAAEEAPRDDPPAALLLDAPPPPPPPPAPPAPPAAAPAAPATPMPAPAPAAATATEAADAAMKDRAQAQERRAARSESTAAMRTAGPEPGADSVTVTGSRIRQAQPTTPERMDEYLDEPLDDRPPVSFATPEARDAWLQRIRELVAEGERDAARASLEEFRRRYPQHPLPADLKALLAE